MNRSRRVPLAKQFVAGGVYNGNGLPGITPALKPVLKNVEQPVVVAQSQPEPQNPNQDNEMVKMEEQEFFEDPQEAMFENEDIADENGEKKAGKKAVFKTLFLKRKKSSVRIKEKKLRQNRQLRKALLPKNALMALNEVKGVSISDFVITNVGNTGFSAVVTVNDVQYEGKGHSKMAAKNDACEKALRDYVIEKMRQHPRNPKTKSLNEPMDTAENTENANVQGSEENGDDVPMINLASFALFKLFSVWESEGFQIPEMHQITPSGPPASGNVSNADSYVAVKDFKHSIRNELPADWENLHPATLLCLMRPGLNYHDTATLGDDPKQQTIYIVVDDVRFDGVGRSKKIARRNAAALACNQTFGTTFTLIE